MSTQPQRGANRNTTGKPSPQWAFWARFTIPCRGGLTYLKRLRVVQTPLFGLYLHDIYERDHGAPHNHPWSFVSVVLRGGYIEDVYPNPRDAPDFFLRKWRRRFSAHAMGRKKAHMITAASRDRKGRPVKTLIIVGPRANTAEGLSRWGFFVGGDYVPWDEYAGER